MPRKQKQSAQNALAPAPGALGAFPLLPCVRAKAMLIWRTKKVLNWQTKLGGTSGQPIVHIYVQKA